MSKLLDIARASLSSINRSPLPDLLPIAVPWMPFKYVVAITSKCNLKCTICIRTIMGIEDTNMPLAVFERLSKVFNGRDVAFLGAGEPFMHPNLFDFIGICQSRKSSVDLVTNGTLLNYDRCNKLLEYPNVQSIGFSIDGIAENYDRIRIGSKFGDVISNLALLHHLKTAKGLTKPMLALNFTGMQSNIDDFPKLIEITAPYIQSAMLMHSIMFTSKDSREHLNRHYEHTIEVLKECQVITKKYGIRLELRPLVPRAGKCIIPFTVPYIGVKGDVYPCCMIDCNEAGGIITEYYDGIPMTRNLKGHSLGNVMNYKFGELWNGQKMQQFRGELKAVNAKYTKEYGEKDYEQMIREWKMPDNYCKICMIRWNCAC